MLGKSELSIGQKALVIMHEAMEWHNQEQIQTGKDEVPQDMLDKVLTSQPIKWSDSSKDP